MESMPLELRVYFYIGLTFSILFVIKLLGLFIGTDVDSGNFGDFDFFDDGGMSSAEAFNVFTVQSAIAFGMIFGWATLAARTEYHLSTAVSISIGVSLGVLGALFSTYLMKLTTKLNSPAEKQYKVTVGTKAKVYLRVPANNQGFGLIHVTKNQTNYEIKVKNVGAEEIPSHSEVIVVASEPEVVVELVTKK